MTLEEFVKNYMCKAGFQEVAGMELTWKDGRKTTIHSDDHPALKQTVTAGDEPTVRPVQSAQGG